jgi:hypothetical protein
MMAVCALQRRRRCSNRRELLRLIESSSRIDFRPVLPETKLRPIPVRLDLKTPIASSPGAFPKCGISEARCNRESCSCARQRRARRMLYLINATPRHTYRFNGWRRLCSPIEVQIGNSHSVLRPNRSDAAGVRETNRSKASHQSKMRPRLRMAFGSRAAFSRRIVAISAPLRQSCSHGFLSKPMPCSAEIEPPWSAIRR